MKKSTSLKKLSLKKLTISRLTNADRIQGGSGICGGTNSKSDPVEDCPLTCNAFLSGCRSCNSQHHTEENC
ncbi:hypothetical protein SAMN06265376_106151 [Dokdonia pacifica]|uniref:Uncharacterized protein n=1 Tax=Dokdonia pacifica TaxID=1627892 RepID=A0A239BGH3_9FLAO|nr:hypothetical protein SAMN06265376_106151 [Dokdonia pacifica]